MMFLVVLLYSLLLAATGQQDKNDWVDPFDMLNYDAGSKTMRKPAQPTEYNNVPTKRREYTQDSGMAALDLCRKQVVDLQREIEEQKKQIALILQQPTCSPVFKRFLNRLLNEMQRVGVPSDSSDAFYDAKISLSRQGMTEIQALLDGDDNCRTGALDNAISQILVDLRPQDYEAWKWRFEDTFGVEIDTLLKMGMFVLAIVAIICTELWSAVSWFVQFKRVFAVSFFISIIWNWFYLYKIAFAEHQNNIMKMDKEVEKCTGVKKIDWSDSLKEWFRSTWTLQDDPCKKYYEAIMVNPILLVPPTKALSVTITTFITEPLKHVGKGISDFLIALLKDLPITLQVPVLLIIVIAIVVCMYGSVQAAFQYGITAPLRHRRDPPPPELEQPQPQLQRVDYLARGDALKQAPRHQADNGRLHGNQVHQRRANRLREEPAPVVVETLRTADPAYSEDEIDAVRPEVEQNPSAESDSENQQEILEELAGASAGRVEANVAQAQNKPSKLNLNQSEAEPVTVNANCSQGESSRDDAALRPQATGRQPSQTDVQVKRNPMRVYLSAEIWDQAIVLQMRRASALAVPCSIFIYSSKTKHRKDLEALAGDEASSISVGLSVQETCPTPAE